jgi:type III secretion system FlhB-like substrate exporter
VALAYDRGGAPAPVVVAVGRGAIAASLLAAARAGGIAVARDPDLVTVLQRLQAGAEIPPPTYQRVAEHLRAAAPVDVTVNVNGNVNVGPDAPADGDGTSRQDA